MKKLYTEGPLDYYGYSKDDEAELKATLEELGFEYKRGEFGGGPEELIQILAHLNINAQTVTGVIVLNLLSNLIYDVLKKLAKWWQTHGNKQQGRPVTLVYIYKSKNTHIFNTFYIDKEYTKQEIKEILKQKTNKN